MQWVVAVVNDGEQFGEGSPVSYGHHRVLLCTNDRAGLFDYSVQALCVPLFGAATPAHHSIEKDTEDHRLVKCLQHSSADIKGCQSPQEIQPILHLLVDMVSVR